MGQQFLCDQTLAGTGCGFWPDRQRMPIRRGGSWRLHRSMMAALALMLLGSAALRCRSCASGWCGSTRAVPMG